MADKKKMSVEEILSACRQQVGPDEAGTPPAGSEAGTAPAGSEDASQASQTQASPAKSKATSAKPASMSVDDILAAARASKADADQASSGPKKEVAAKPAAASGGKSGEMSIDDILASARAGKATGSSEKAAVSKKETASPTAKPKSPTAKPRSTATDKVATSPAEGPADTSSILAAARKQVKRGPMSKAEAAARGPAVESKPEAKVSPSRPKADRRIAPPMPQKPAYAQAKDKSKGAAGGERRGFLVVLIGSFLAIGFMALSSVFGLFALGVARFMFPNILTEPPNRFKVGFPGDFAAGMVETKFKALYGVWVVNAEYDGQPQIVALKSVCTHLGCTPNWLDTEQKFKCPCHGSGFYKDGVNFEGPAPRPLERYAIHLADDGQLEVDKSRTFQEEMGQWQDPACFVPV